MLSCLQQMVDGTAGKKLWHRILIGKTQVFALLVITTVAVFLFLYQGSPLLAHGSEDFLVMVEENVTWRNNILSRLHRKHKCTCSKAFITTTAKVGEEKAALLGRRSKEMAKDKKRMEPNKDKLVMVKGQDPLSYPVRGLTVVPEGTIQIPGLEVVEQSPWYEYKVQLQASDYGTLDTIAEVAEVHSEGLGSKSMVIRSNSLARLNQQLQYVVYTNNVYDIDATDIVTFRYRSHEASIAIQIRAPSVPFLYDPGPKNYIEARVTIVTKTFIRYAAIRALLASIRNFYPNIRVIVADDSRPVQDLQGKNVDHYVMPNAMGWFAGRNLAVSQVATEYLLWVDDDFVFIPETKLENLREVLENTNLDLAAGVVGGNGVKYTKMTIVPGDEDGDCLVINDLHHWGQVPGFPRCYYATRVTNFFLARTDSVRAVGFDPVYSRLAHTEFFMAGMGKLRVAACDNVRVNHKSVKAGSYHSFRYPGEDYQIMKKEHQYFKHNIKCWESDTF